MSRPVFILGIGADGPEGLSARSREILAGATFVAGGRRHLAMMDPGPAETFTITNNLAELADRLRRRAEDERCVVLASGDPLFFGVGHFLGEALGRDQIRVEPSVSSLQLAFARAGLAWHDATVASIHGRPLAETLLPLLGRPKIGLFTQDGGSPEAVARFFLERGLGCYTAVIGEDLGSSGERTTALPLAEVPGRRFSDLNVLLLVRTSPPPAEAPGPCPPDARFARPESPPILLTHADVRAVVLSRFAGMPPGPLWDVGAGLGGISIGLSRTFPAREVVAAERSQIQAAFLRENRRRFEAHNLRIIEGTAPDCLDAEAAPAGVFVGGSGGHLDEILRLVLARLSPGGVLVADFVGLENLEAARSRLRAAEWPVELSLLQVSHGQELAGLTVLTPLRPVWILRSSRPARV